MVYQKFDVSTKFFTKKRDLVKNLSDSTEILQKTLSL